MFPPSADRVIEAGLIPDHCRVTSSGTREDAEAAGAEVTGADAAVTAAAGRDGEPLLS